MRANRPWTQAENDLLVCLYESGISKSDIASRLNRTPGSVSCQVGKLRRGGLRIDRYPTVSEIPSANRPVEELFAARAAEYKRKRSHHQAKVAVDVDLGGEGPYALAFFGDAHVDDPGCDIEYLAYCMERVGADGNTHAINVGDLSNNWIGSLSRLYAHQSATDDEAGELVGWLLDAVPWLFVVLGNHDQWSPVAKLLLRQRGIPYASHGAKLHVRRGETTLIVDARHDHKGRSMYNPAHGQLSQNYRGSNADIIIGGHTHQSAYTLMRNGVTGQVSHCLRVSAFKRFDDYADQLGLPDQALSPIVLAVIDPAREGVGMVMVHHDLDRGLAELEALRGK